MALNLKSERADEIATRLATIRGISKTRLIEDLLEREWRAHCAAPVDAQTVAQAFWDDLRLDPAEIDRRPLAAIRDELWDGL